MEIVMIFFIKTRLLQYYVLKITNNTFMGASLYWAFNRLPVGEGNSEDGILSKI